jgi:hypothetical protein
MPSTARFTQGGKRGFRPSEYEYRLAKSRIAQGRYGWVAGVLAGPFSPAGKTPLTVLDAILNFHGILSFHGKFAPETYG